MDEAGIPDSDAKIDPERGNARIWHDPVLLLVGSQGDRVRASPFDHPCLNSQIRRAALALTSKALGVQGVADVGQTVSDPCLKRIAEAKLPLLDYSKSLIRKALKKQYAFPS